MFALLKYVPVIFGVVRTMRRNPKVRKAYEQAKRRRARASSRRR
jgi:GrpB-like predicted nucleotidyltransferase (UPF0157 family)